MPHVPAHAADLVVDLLEAARCLEKLTPDELRGLLRDAAAVLCELVSPDDCPPEAREAGCPRIPATGTANSADLWASTAATCAKKLTIGS